VSEAKKMAADLHTDAMESLTEFGSKAQRLRELADFIINRKY
jgi:farnesyl diphosphate synthase